MLVRQLIGPYAGDVQEMPFAVAQRLLDRGTVELPDKKPAKKKMGTIVDLAAARAKATPKRRAARKPKGSG